MDSCRDQCIKTMVPQFKGKYCYGPVQSSSIRGINCGCSIRTCRFESSVACQGEISNVIYSSSENGSLRSGSNCFWTDSTWHHNTASICSSIAGSCTSGWKYRCLLERYLPDPFFEICTTSPI